jgi:hypothetical protein
MIPPKMAWMPCWLSADTEDIVFTPCVLPSQEEAERVVEVWKSEGHDHRLLVINSVPIYDTADEWLRDR